MPISKPILPPREGYVEVEVNDKRKYRNVKTGVLLEDESTQKTYIDLMASAYKEGVNEAE